jgi:hypothetical protein
MNLPGGQVAGGSSTVLYYSLLVHVSDLTGLTVANTNVNANNDVFAAFSNGAGTQAGRPTTWAAALTMRLGTAANTYQIGVRSSGTAAASTFFSSNFTVADTLLIVVSYKSSSVAGANDGSSSIWINPDSSTFGGETAPTATGTTAGSMSATAGTDHADSFIIGAGIAAGTDPNETDIDELRIGTSWADVTVAPEPGAGGAFVLIGLYPWLKRRRASSSPSRRRRFSMIA